MLNKKAYYSENPYRVETSQNGSKYVAYETVLSTEINISKKNSKVGNVLGFNFPVHYTCNHNCECYKLKKCYACGGCYAFASNQSLYSENLAFYFAHTENEFIEKVSEKIAENPKYKLFRWFEIGDILSFTFFKSMIEIAKRNPQINFWSYTKKYEIVNRYCDLCGKETIPENLTIIFSHWMNEDGTYFKMENPYNFPTSEFIPVSKEYLAESVTHICPCSDPNVLTTCENCEHACYKLTYGQSMALLEHSTRASKERDKAVRESHERIKKERKTA